MATQRRGRREALQISDYLEPTKGGRGHGDGASFRISLSIRFIIGIGISFLGFISVGISFIGAISVSGMLPLGASKEGVNQGTGDARETNSSPAEVRQMHRDDDKYERKVEGSLGAT